MKAKQALRGGEGPLVFSSAFYLAPQDDIEGPLLDLVAQAKRSILIEIYGFALPSLTDALIAAKQRGVEVKILFDHTQACGVKERELVKRIAEAGIEHWVGTSPRHAIRHSKFMIVDEEISEHGSYNYSKSAKDQNNTVEITRSRDRAAKLIADFYFNRAWIQQNEPQYNTPAV